MGSSQTPDARVARSRTSSLGLACLLTTQVLSAGALATAASLLLWSMLPLALGWQAHAVVSGSMAPAIQAGDVVLTQPVGDVQLEPGFVVSFPDPTAPGRSVMHRIASVGADGSLTTRGDANNADDLTPVPRSSVDGLGRLRIPYVGLLVVWQRESRFVPLAGALLVLVTATWLVTLGDGRPPGSPPPVPRDGRRLAGQGTRMVPVATGTTVPVTVATTG